MKSMVVVAALSLILGVIFGVSGSLFLSQQSYSTWVRENDIWRSFEIEQRARVSYLGSDFSGARDSLVISRFLLQNHKGIENPDLFFPFASPGLKAVDIGSSASVRVLDCVIQYLEFKQIELDGMAGSAKAGCPAIAEEFLRIR